MQCVGHLHCEHVYFFFLKMLAICVCCEYHATAFSASPNGCLLLCTVPTYSQTVMLWVYATPCSWETHRGITVNISITSKAVTKFLSSNSSLPLDKGKIYREIHNSIHSHIWQKLFFSCGSQRTTVSLETRHHVKGHFQTIPSFPEGFVFLFCFALFCFAFVSFCFSVYRWVLIDNQLFALAGSSLSIIG